MLTLLQDGSLCLLLGLRWILQTESVSCCTREYSQHHNHCILTLVIIKPLYSHCCDYKTIISSLMRVTGNLQPYSLLQAFFIRSHANERVLEPSSPAKGKVTIVFKMMKEGTDAASCILKVEFSIQMSELF